MPPDDQHLGVSTTQTGGGPGAARHVTIVGMAKFTEGGKAQFKRDYFHGWIFRKKIPQGKRGLITKVYGVLDDSHVDIQLADGKLLREVPVKYLRPE